MDIQKISASDGADDFDAFTASSNSDHVDSVAAYRAQSHFYRDCLWIAEKLQGDINLMPGVVAFVLLTIQQQFTWMPQQVKDVAQFGTKSRFMFGWKPDGLEFARQNKRRLWQAASAVWHKESSLDDLILEYLSIPGLGIVKASFLAQLTVADGACLDTVNIQRLGLAADAFKTPKSLKIGALKARLLTYNATWRAHGDSAYWWDTWCDTLADRTEIDSGRTRKDGTRIFRNMMAFSSGAVASATHRLAVTGGIR